MPSHPDRVRRNYHDIILNTYEIVRTNEQIININITKHEIASIMSKYEMERHILSLIRKGIQEQYNDNQ